MINSRNPREISKINVFVKERSPMSSRIRAQRVILTWFCLLFLACSSVPPAAYAQSSKSEFARALISAMTDEERKKLLAADKELINVELVQALLLEGRRLAPRGEYSGALKAFELAFTLSELVHYPIGAADALRGMGRVRHSQGNPTQALEDYQRSLRISEELGYKQGIAHVLNNIGRLHYSRGQYGPALDCYQRSLKISDETGDKEGFANTLNNIGHVYYSQGNYAGALKCYRDSLKISEELGDKQGIAISLINIGIVQKSQGNYSQALAYYERSLELSQELGNKREIAIVLNNIGIVHKLQGNYPQALEHYQRSLKIQEELGSKEDIAKCLNNIGNIHKSQGNYTKALEHFQRSLRISEELGDKEHISIVLNNTGNIHMAQANNSQALQHFQRSLKISEELGDKQGIAIAHGNLGIVYYSERNHAKAFEHYDRSLRIKEELGDKPGIVNTLSNIGIVHYSEGNYAQALEYYDRSLKIKEELGDKPGIAITLISIGNVLKSQGDPAKALQTYQKSLKISEELGDIQRIAITLGEIGVIHYSQGNRAKARQVFSDAISAVEELRARVAGSEQQQQQFFETQLPAYHQMVMLLMNEQNSADALSYAERVKARALLDTLRGGRVAATSAMTENEKAEERKLNTEVVSVNVQIACENSRTQPDEARLRDLKFQREKARANYEAFQINLYAAHPELRIQRGRIQPISRSEAGKLIPNAGTVILEFVVTDDITYLFVLSKDEQSLIKPKSSADLPVLNVYTINTKQKDLAGRIDRLRSRLIQKDAEFTDSARALFDLLIGPAQADLKSKTGLIIVPDGVLWQLPFQALQTSVNRFLIQDYTISYAPSLTVLSEMMDLKQKRQASYYSSPMLLAFGNPDVQSATTANLQAVYPGILGDEKVASLPQTEKLVNTLCRLYGADRSKVYVGTDAREDRVKKEAASFRILQFATHGIVDNTNPMYSRLVMSQSGVDEHEDGMLEAWEIMKLDLNAEIAVLSACETAQGRVAGGEGMIGLAWAFFVAGCPTTVVSQWPVAAQSTTELMIEFHKNLKPNIEGQNSGMSKAEALRAASLKLMKNRRYRHPFYWAPFVIIGDGR